MISVLIVNTVIYTEHFIRNTLLKLSTSNTHQRASSLHIVGSAVHEEIQTVALKGNLFFTTKQLILMSRIIKMAEVCGT